MPRRPSILASLQRLPVLVRLALAFGCGAAGAWAMPPDPQPLALIVHYAGMLALLTTVTRVWTGFAIGWMVGFAYHLVGLSWIGEAFLVDADQFGWMRPFAIAGLPAILAVFPGLAAAIYIRLARKQGILANIACLASLLTIADWLRGTILTGFPWNLPAQAWDAAPGVLQSVATVGPYGLSLASILAAASVAAVALTSLRHAAWIMPMACLPLAGLAALGIWDFRQAPAVMPSVADVKLRLVQPNIPQREKWQAQLRSTHFARHLSLSKEAAASGVTHIIWPEAATPFLLAESPNALAAIAGVVPRGGALLTGTPRRPAATSPAGGSQSDTFTNALVVIDDAGRVTATYDKHHLVPFGEYVPLRNWLPVDRLAPGRGDFSAGPGPRTIAVPSAPPTGPLICYEAIFPDQITDAVNRPGWLLNVTNDAWFGSSSGPHQHLSIARLRAIEQGLPLVRVANTGISAVIDPYGRILESLPIGTGGVIDAALPQPRPSPPLFARTDSIVLPAILLFLIATLYGFSRRRHSRVARRTDVWL